MFGRIKAKDPRHNMWLSAVSTATKLAGKYYQGYLLALKVSVSLFDKSSGALPIIVGSCSQTK